MKLVTIASIVSGEHQQAARVYISYVNTVLPCANQSHIFSTYSIQDPHIDRVMATLVGSRAPGDSTCIQDIILPSKLWVCYSVYVPCKLVLWCMVNEGTL